MLQADCGQRALEAVTRALRDVVVLDLMLPDISGEEVARTLREGSDVPIIMLTAKAAEEHRVLGLRVGADDYLVKPFSLRELVPRSRPSSDGRAGPAPTRRCRSTPASWSSTAMVLRRLLLLRLRSASEFGKPGLDLCVLRGVLQALELSVQG